MASRRRTPSLLRPTVFSFEDRLVPASYYVDTEFTGLANGTIVTFNAGETNAVAGLEIGTNAFAFYGDAITKANADAAADTIFLSGGTVNNNGTFQVDPAANLGPYLITNPLFLVGSGKGVTQFISISDTPDVSGTLGALFAAQNTVLNVSNLTLDGGFGGGKLAASGFRYEGSTGTVDNVTFQNVRDNSIANSVGYGLVVTGAGSDVVVSNSAFTGNGRGGVRFDDNATGIVKSSTFTGRSGITANDINYGVDITNNSSALVTGNVITGFTGFNGAVEASAAVQIALSSSANIYGNTFDGNATGIIVGIGGGDDSSADIQFNNIINNDSSLGAGSGIFSDTTGTVNAVNNFWGSKAGPQAPDNGGGTDTSSVTAGVTYKNATITQPPQGIAQGPLPVQVVGSPSEAEDGASPTVIITGPATGVNSPISVTITFSEVVTGFIASDIVLGGTAGAAAVTNLTTSDGITYTATISVSQRGTLTVNVADGVAVNLAGIGNLPGNANIPFQAPFDRGFAAAGDAGAVTPVIGVTDTFATRLNTPVFGGGYTGGERVATADLNGDGTLDYIVATGGGISTAVVALDGITQKQVFSIQPFGAAFVRGAYVSGGDLTGDGRAEIVITAERGGGARVRIFTPDANGNFTQLSDFFGIIGADGKADTAFRGGARSAVGDVNGDGRNDLIFAAGTGGGPRVALFNGLTLGINGGPKLTGDFFVFEPTLRDGSNVAAGDLNGDGKAELIVGAGNGAARVRAINGNTLITSNGGTVTALADYFAYGSAGKTGVRVAADDLDGDGKIDIITGPGANSGSNVRVYSGANLTANPNAPAITQELNLFGTFTGGVFVG